MKAQLRTFETVSVIFVFFILLGLGLVFYGNMNSSSIQKEMQKNMELRALNTAEQAQNLPELTCSTNNVAVEKCFDQLKLVQVQGMTEKYDAFFFDSFGYAEISVDEVYPASTSWKIYNKPKTGFKTKLAIQIPVTISDTITKQNKFGILTVNVYE